MDPTKEHAFYLTRPQEVDLPKTYRWTTAGWALNTAPRASSTAEADLVTARRRLSYRSITADYR